MNSSAVSGPHNLSSDFNNFSLSKVTVRTKNSRRVSFSKITEDNFEDESCQFETSKLQGTEVGFPVNQLHEESNTLIKLDKSNLIPSKEESSTDKLINVVKESVNQDTEFFEVTPEKILKNDEELDHNHSTKLESSNIKRKKKAKRKSDIDEMESRLLKKYLNKIKKDNKVESNLINDKPDKLPETKLKAKRTKEPNEIDVMRRLLLSNAHESLSSSSFTVVKKKKGKKGNNIDKKGNSMLQKHSINNTTNNNLKRNLINEILHDNNLKVKRKRQISETVDKNEVTFIKQQLLSNAFKTWSSPTQSVKVATKKKSKNNDINKLQDCVLKKASNKIKREDIVKTGLINDNPTNVHETKLKIKRKKKSNEIDEMRKQLLSNAIKSCSPLRQS